MSTAFSLCFRGLALATLLFCLVADYPVVTIPVTHVTRSVDLVEDLLPNTDIELVTNDDSRRAQVLKIRHFLRKHQVTVKDFHDNELHQIADKKVHQVAVTETTWVKKDVDRNPICLITVNKVDYHHAGLDYWKFSWDIDDQSLDLDINPVYIGDWDIHHELYHCMAFSLHLGNSHAMPSPISKELYEEAGADVYAALAHIQRTGDRRLIKIIQYIREARVNEDKEHYTRDALNDLYNNEDQYNQANLAGMNPVQLARTANAIVDHLWFQLDEDLIRLNENGQRSKALQERGYNGLKELSEQEKARATPRAGNLLSDLRSIL